MQLRCVGAAVERVKGIEPSYAAWEAAVLPLNYTRAPGRTGIILQPGLTVQSGLHRVVAFLREPS